MFDIITIGSATRDVFLFIGALHAHKAKDAPAHIEACLPFGAKINIERIHYDTGGGGTNNAATFARLGKYKVASLVRIGVDSRGRSILSALRADRVTTTFVQKTTTAYTAYSAILSPAHNGGERTILVHRGASSHIEHDKIPWGRLKTRWFYVSSLGGDIALFKKILPHAKKINAQVVWNPGGAELSQLALPHKVRSRPNSPPLGVRGGWEGLRDVLAFLILNREEAAQLTGARFNDTKGLLRALARLVPTAIMTDGPKGAYAVVSKEHRAKSIGQNKNLRALSSKPYAVYYVPSAGSKPKNLTGAGDAFGSGFLTGWIKSHGDIKEALRVGSFNADSVVQHIGAKVGILKNYPSKSTLTRLPIKTLPL